MLASVVIGATFGTLIPGGFVLSFYVLEKVAARKAQASGQKRWLTFQPRKMAIDEDGFAVLLEGYIDFAPTSASYNKVAEVLITLSSASPIFIPSLHLNSSLPWLGLPLVLLGFMVVYAHGFMGFLTYFYEQSLYDPTNMTSFRQAINYGLGFGALSALRLLIS